MRERGELMVVVVVVVRRRGVIGNFI